jgi:hypothetical protein
MRRFSLREHARTIKNNDTTKWSRRMKLDELITITEKLRTVNIPDAEAQSNLDAAIVYLDLTINRVRVAAKQPAAQAAQRGEAG